MSQPATEEPNTDTSAGGGDDGGASSAGSGTGAANPEASGTPETIAKADHDAVVARMKAADQRAAKFEAELKAFRDKDLPEQEKLKKDHAELEAKYSALQETNKKLALESAFLKANSFKWKDAEAALKLADLSGVEISDDGTVTGLEAALKSLATKSKWLLEEEAGDSDKDGKGSAGAPPMGASATNRGTGIDKGKLKSTYSALRMRG